MHEAILKDFLVGVAAADVLKADLSGAVIQVGPNRFEQRITRINEKLVVTRDHLVRLCDAVLDQSLDPSDLEPIAFCIIASDHFEFDDDTPYNNRILDTLHDWDSPEINYVLSVKTVEKLKKRLLTGESTLTRDDYGSSSSA